MEDFEVGVQSLIIALASKNWSDYFGHFRQMVGAFLDPTYRAALGTAGVEDAVEREEIIDEIYQTCLDAIPREPESNMSHWCYTSMLLEKKD